MSWLSSAVGDVYQQTASYRDSYSQHQYECVLRPTIVTLANYRLTLGFFSAWKQRYI